MPNQEKIEETRIECPRKKKYGKCLVVGCGYCGYAKKLLTMPNQPPKEISVESVIKELFYLAHIDYSTEDAICNSPTPEEEARKILNLFAAQEREKEREKMREEIEKYLVKCGGCQKPTIGCDNLEKFLSAFNKE